MKKTFAWAMVAMAFAIMTAACALKPPSPPAEPPPPPPPPPVPVASQVPVPAAYPISAQPKMQAVEHWQHLANVVARQVAPHALSQPQPQGVVFVAPSGTTLFEKTFRSLLITELVALGVEVSEDRSQALVLGFDLTLVNHSDDRIQTGPGMYTSLAPRFAIKPGDDGHLADAEQATRQAQVEVEAGMYTRHLPGKEIVVTASLTAGNSYLVRHTAAFYINDQDWWHYKSRMRRLEPTVASYRIVGE